MPDVMTDEELAMKLVDEERAEVRAKVEKALERLHELEQQLAEIAIDLEG